MAIRQTIAKTYFNSASAQNASFASPCVAGNTILIALNAYRGGGGITCSASDDSAGGANGYVEYSATDAAARTMFFITQDIVAAQQLTLTPGATLNAFWQAWEISNCPASSLDQLPQFYSDADSSPNASVTSLTPSQTGNLVFVACCSREDSVSFTLTSPSGYTVEHLDTTQSGASISSSMAYKTGTTSTQTASWTHGTGFPGSAGIIMVKQSSASILLRMVQE